MRLPINIIKLRIFPMKSEETSTTPAVYDVPIDFNERFMSFTDTPKQIPASIYGDGVKTNEYNAKDGGELTLNIQRVSGEERVKLYGETAEEDGSVSMGSDDLIPYAAVIFTVENDDGTIDIRKYPKIKLTEQPESVEQKGANGIKYSTTSFKGNYQFLLDKKKARYILEDIDPTTDEGKKKIEDWYADGNPFSQKSSS